MKDTKKCLICKKEFIKSYYCSLKDWKTRKYCSRECAKATLFHNGITPWNKGKSVRLNPIGEFKKGFKWSDEIKDKMKGRIPWNKGTKGIMKSNSGTFRPGNIPIHKGKGITPQERLFRNCKEYKDWRTTVLKRDDFICVWCGYKSHTRVNGHSDMVVDHIKSYALYPELRTKIENGRTLCYWCHKKTETYGLNKQFFISKVVI